MSRIAVSPSTILLLFTTLAPAAEPTDAERLAKSLEAWQAAKVKCGGNYSYTVGTSSFTGFRTVTKIVVRDNEVVARSYTEIAPPRPVAPGGKPGETKPKWVETGKEIGKHGPGAKARTVDELYAAAKKMLAKPANPNERLYVKFDKAGLLAHCFAVDTRIADDAPLTGVPPFKLTLEAKE